MRMDLLNEEIIREVKKDNCFDFLRYLFAFSLVLAHFCVLIGVDNVWFITGSMRVKAFFTITGFLVTYSFCRGNFDLSLYAKKRFARIIPAYVICIVFCLVLGMVVSSLGIADFMTSAQTWKYFIVNLFMLNWLEPELPSTFQSNIMPQMNGSLWTMKQEVVFYILVPIIVWLLRKTGTKHLILPLLLLCVIAYPSCNTQTQKFMYFISGATALLYFNIIIRYKKWIFPPAVVMLIATYYIDIPVLTPLSQALELIVFPTLLLLVAYNLKCMNFMRRYDNITYGMFLYHFPIIQVLILTGVTSFSKPLGFALTILFTTILACISWFFIEKPLMAKYRN